MNPVGWLLPLPFQIDCDRLRAIPSAISCVSHACTSKKMSSSEKLLACGYAYSSPHVGLTLRRFGVPVAEREPVSPTHPELPPWMVRSWL